MVTSVFYFLIASAGIQLEDLTSEKVLSLLQKNTLWNDMLRWMGSIFYSWFSALSDAVESMFDVIYNIDLSTTIELGQFEMTLSDLAWDFLFVCIIVYLAVKMLAPDGSFAFLRNFMIAVTAIAVFSAFYDFSMELKNTVNTQIVNGLEKQDMTISEQLFYENCYDMLASAKADEAIKIKQTVDPQDHDLSEVISKSDLQGKMIVDADSGEVTYEDLRDGIAGIMDERYYRYSISFWDINVPLLLSAFFGIICAYKVAYILLDLFFQKLTGILAIGAHAHKMEKVGAVFASILMSCAALIYVNTSYLLFGRIYNGITASGAGLLGSVIFIVAYSFLVLVGGNFLKNLGIDDGSNFLLRSAFMGRMLARSGHTLKTKLDHAAETTTNAIAQGAGMVGRNWADRYHSTYQNTQPMPEMAPGNINEGKPPADRIETVSGKGLPDRSFEDLGIMGEQYDPDRPNDYGGGYYYHIDETQRDGNGFDKTENSDMREPFFSQEDRSVRSYFEQPRESETDRWNVPLPEENFREQSGYTSEELRELLDTDVAARSHDHRSWQRRK